MRAASRSLRQLACCPRRGLYVRRHRPVLWDDIQIPGFWPESSRPRRLVSVRGVTSTATALETRGGEDLDQADFVDACLEHNPPFADDEQSASLAVLQDHGLTPGMPASSFRKPQHRVGEYGKWNWLSLQYFTLRRESDVEKMDIERLVDDPRYEDDIQLWRCILNYRYRRDGHEGVFAVLRGLQMRHGLKNVSGPYASMFWGTMLKEAVLHEGMLVMVWEYAEWLYKEHGVRWPNLYETVLSSFISRRQPEKAVQWHLRLCPNYGPEAPAFGELLRRFICDPDPAVQSALWSLYQLSHHHQLYDNLLPYLYSEGRLSLARTWRRHLILYGDVPSTFAARSFLRFLAGYFPQGYTVRPERLAAGLREENDNDSRDLAKYEGVGRYRQLLNRIYGRTFGIREKSYDDSLGARWFASSWISLDLALDVVRFLGLDQIGPLSLQSIALREGHSDRILDRLDQLELSGISIGESSYAKAIRHFATVDDNETLMNLLYSDMHPDVFDDLETQRKILKVAMKHGTWKEYRLVLSVQSAASLDTVALASNRLVIESLNIGNYRMAIRIIEDLYTRGVQLLPSTSDAVSMHIIDNLSAEVSEDQAILDDYFALCRLVMAMRFPLATQATNCVLYHLGKRGRLEELERLSLEILQRYTAMWTSTRPTLNVHRFDVPEILREEPRYGKFQLIPRELNLGHGMHPIQQIFDKGLQEDILYWGFTSRHESQPLPHTARNPNQPVDFSFARGIRLLAMLRDHGVEIVAYSQVQKSAELHVAMMLGDYPGTRRSKVPRWMAQLGVEGVKSLCDQAWGSELLPSVFQLKDKIREVSQRNTDIYERVNRVRAALRARREPISPIRVRRTDIA